MIKFLLLVSRQGKVRLSKFYETLSSKDKAKITREVTTLVLNRGAKMCNIVEYKEQKIVYKRYASLYFVTCVEKDDNELMVLETIHHFVEILDRYFGNVCELDVIFNFHKAYYLLDEVLLGGELQESNKREVLRVCAAQDDMSTDEEAAKKLMGGAAGAGAGSGIVGSLAVPGSMAR